MEGLRNLLLTHFCRGLLFAFNLCFCYVPFIINLIGVQISNFVHLALSVQTVLHPVIFDRFEPVHYDLPRKSMFMHLFFGLNYIINQLSPIGCHNTMPGKSIFWLTLSLFLDQWKKPNKRSDLFTIKVRFSC